MDWIDVIISDAKTLDIGLDEKTLRFLVEHFAFRKHTHNLKEIPSIELEIQRKIRGLVIVEGDND